MILEPTVLARWDTREYRRITSARYASGTLIVDFEDGSCVRLDVAALRPARGQTPNWVAVRATPFEVVVPTDGDDLEIPWSTIRMHTDSAFDAHLAAAAVAQRQHIGHRLHDLRDEQGLSVEELAQRAQMDPADVARIEAGDPSTEFPPVQRLLEAMGHSLDALVVAPGTRFDG